MTARLTEEYKLRLNEIIAQLADEYRIMLPALQKMAKKRITPKFSIEDKAIAAATLHDVGLAVHTLDIASGANNSSITVTYKAAGRFLQCAVDNLKLGQVQDPSRVAQSRIDLLSEINDKYKALLKDLEKKECKKN